MNKIICQITMVKLIFKYIKNSSTWDYVNIYFLKTYKNLQIDEKHNILGYGT
jgi:hypothetical protein